MEQRRKIIMIDCKNTRNPILPLHIHIPDCEAHVMPDGKLYIYGSFDDWANTYCSEKYYVVSTVDMENWKVHDVAFEGKQVSWFYEPEVPKYLGLDWSNPTPFIKRILEEPRREPVILDGEIRAEELIAPRNLEDVDGRQPAFLYAPDAIYKEGKYYLYFCMSDDSEGVAVSDRPEGPFTNPRQLPCCGIDPAIFKDTDGQVYYFWGQLFLNVVKLNSDMVSFDEKTRVSNLITEEEHFFHEGASMRKIGDTYYLVYSNMERGKPTALGYATSKSPLGPFQYRGIIVDNASCDPASWNNHGSIECFNGQWYVFYHRSSRCSRAYRRLCIEPIRINPDGTIDEVKMTSQGVGKPFCREEIIFGYQACELAGTVFIGINEQGSEWLTNISPQDEIVFRYVETDRGYRTVVIDTEGCGIIDCYLDDCFVGSVTVQAHGLNQGGIIDTGSGVRKLKLFVREARKLKIKSIVLY